MIEPYKEVASKSIISTPNASDNFSPRVLQNTSQLSYNLQNGIFNEITPRNYNRNADGLA